MRLLALVVLLGCDKGGATDLSTPSGAARCLVGAAEAKSIDRWLDCTHPDARAEMRGELEKEIRDRDFWADAATKLAPLAGVKDEQFTIAPTTGKETRWGDTRASYRYSERGKLDLVKQDGRWYVADPD